MKPHYYLMKEKKILRLEQEVTFDSLPEKIKLNLLIDEENQSMNQDQANWRVVLFRDEIMEFEEYTEWLETAPDIAH